MQLQHIHENVYYLTGFVNIGVVVASDDRAILIDSGIGDRSARQVLRTLQTAGLTPVAVLNTHCHGDHAGGNAYLVEKAGVQVYAPLYDSIVIQYPLWGTLFLFIGADPIHEVRTPRFHARPSPVHVVVSEGPLEVAGVNIEAISLPGHTGTHTGYRVSDVLFLGDALATEEELQRVGLPYGYSVTMQLATLDKLEQMQCPYYLLAHSGVREDIGDLIARNRARIQEVLAFIRDYLAHQPAEAGQVITALADHLGLRLHKVQDYFLLQLTVYAYLSHLHNGGAINFRLEGNRLLWCA